MLTRNGMGIWNLKVHTQWHTSNNASPLNFQKVSLGDYSHSSTATLAASLLKTTWLAVKKENIDLLTSLFHSAVNLYSPRNHSEICIVFDFFLHTLILLNSLPAILSIWLSLKAITMNWQILENSGYLVFTGPAYLVLSHWLVLFSKHPYPSRGTVYNAQVLVSAQRVEMQFTSDKLMLGASDRIFSPLTEKNIICQGNHHQLGC